MLWYLFDIDCTIIPKKSGEKPAKLLLVFEHMYMCVMVPYVSMQYYTHFHFIDPYGCLNECSHKFREVQLLTMLASL